MALIEAGLPVAGMSRRDLQNNISASVALDIIFVTMMRMYSGATRMYYETRETYLKEMKKADELIRDPKMVKREQMKKNIIAMAKYRKAR